MCSSVSHMCVHVCSNLFRSVKYIVMCIQHMCSILTKSGQVYQICSYINKQTDNTLAIQQPDRQYTANTTTITSRCLVSLKARN
uniref:Uncharacterized protein n=1 Tax=Arion vulgaris TaxID=1028688 RepID=A0A0B6ZXB7_9EUPU